MLSTGPILAAPGRTTIDGIQPKGIYWVSDIRSDFGSYRVRATHGANGAHGVTGDDMSIAVLSTNRPRLARQARLEWDPVRERQVLLAPEGILVLNQTGATILGLCDGERTVVEIVDELAGRYDRVDGDEVKDFLARLAAKRWVELHG